MSGPLQGIRVVDLTRVMSGPFASMMLSDLGADIIKVETIGTGDLIRRAGGYRRDGFNALTLSLHRGKRSIAVDLHKDDGRAVVLELAAGADVFIENFRPGVCEAMGLSAERLRAVNPNLIYVSISGYGPDGPAAREPAYDTILQGRSGMIARQVNADGVLDSVHSFPVDKLGGLFAAQAITAALFSRARGTARGQTIQVPMLDAALYYLWPDALNDLNLIGEDVIAGVIPSLVHGPTRTKDGYLAYLAFADSERAAVARAVGRPDLAGDSRYATMAEFAKQENSTVFRAAVAEAFTTLTTDEALGRLQAEGLPCSVVVQPQDVPADPQLAATGALVEYEHPQAGRTRQARHPLRFDGTPTTHRTGAPRLGEHTDQILAEAGFTPAQITDLRASGAVG